MATEKTVLAYEVTLDGKGAEASVGSFKKQLREANNELLNMSAQFGDTSKEAINAAKKVAGLKDAIGDAKALAETFNPDKKFVALGGALQGATAGFSALQGAMGLFGAEGKDVEKMMLKVQSAMALQQGISGIAGAMDSFKLLGNQIKGNVSKAFGTLKGAIAATGIGLLIVGIGLLVANFDSVKAAIEKFIGPLKNVTDFFGKMIDAVTDFVGITSEAERALDKLSAATKRQNETIDSQIKQLTAMGGKDKEIYQAKQQLAENELNNLRETLKVKGGLTEEEKKKFRELNNDKIVNELQNNARIKKENEDSAKDRLALQQKNAAASKELKEKELAKLKEIEDNRVAQQKNSDNLLTENRLAAIKDEFTKSQMELAIKAQAEIDAEAESYNKKLISKQQYEDNVKLINQTTELEQAKLIATKEEKDIADADKKREEENKSWDEEFQRNVDFTKHLQEEAEKRKAIDQASFAAKMEFMDAIGGALGALGNLFEKDTAAAKALALAEIAIGVAKGFINGLNIAQKSSAAAGPGAAFAFPIFYASQVAAVLTAASKAKGILSSVKGAGGGGASMSAPSVSSVSAPLTPQAETTTLSSQSINQIGVASSRAFVLESDVTNNQERMQRLNRAARIN
jgi:hypothetical protein